MLPGSESWESIACWALRQRVRMNGVDLSFALISDSARLCGEEMGAMSKVELGG